MPMKSLTKLLVLLSIAATAPLHAQTFTIGTIAPQHAGWAVEMKAAGDEIAQRTEGRVKFKFRFAQENDRSTLLQMRTRRFQGGMFTPGALQDHYGDINLYSLPLVFNSKEEAAYVRSRMDQKLLDGLEDAGYKGFGFSATGFAVLMSNEPVRGLSDVKGKKVWVPDGDEISHSAMQALGVAPVPHPLGDVLVGLQQNLYHMIAVSPFGALVMQWHTKVKYLTDMPLAYTFGFLVLDKRAYEKIPPADRAIVDEVLLRVHREFDDSGLEDDAEAKEVLVKNGIELVEPDDDDFDAMRKTLAENNRSLARQGVITEELYDEMLGHIEEYRSEHSE